MGFFETAQHTDSLVTNSLWVEKFRPTVLSDYIGNVTLKERVERYIQDNDIPHLLLYGKAGTGKTTLAKMIVNSIECDHLFINASDKNGVEDVRDMITKFASTVGFKPYKIIILDEADGLTPNAQAILRNLMETHAAHCRFILTCNYVEKIIGAVQSRCQSEVITPPSQKEVAVQLAKILQNEQVLFELSDILTVIDTCYPDIRKCINTIQQQSKSGRLVIDKQAMLDADFKSHVIQLLASKKGARDTFNAIRQSIADNRVRDFTDCYRTLFDKVDEYSNGKTTTCILIIADHQYHDALVVDKEISFAACIINLLQETKP